MVKLHFGICIVFFAVGFVMRYGLSNALVKFLYRKIPVLAAEEFDEYKVRRFIGETSIKLGCFPFLIALVGFERPDSLLIAMIAGWISFVLFAISSVTIRDKYDIFKRFKKVRFYGTQAYNNDTQEKTEAEVQEEETKDIHDEAN